MSYQHDIFISYPRGDGTFETGMWVREVFYPILRDCLFHGSPNGARIFIDEEGLENGPELDEQLTVGLRGSAILVPIWSTGYFTRPYCVGEWYSMRAREALVSEESGTRPTLVYPIVYRDGVYFPDGARDALRKRDFSEFTTLDSLKPGQSPKKLMTRFKQEMMRVCEDLVPLILAAPAWRHDWPIDLRPPLPEPHIPNPTKA